MMYKCLSIEHDIEKKVGHYFIIMNIFPYCFMRYCFIMRLLEIIPTSIYKR